MSLTFHTTCDNIDWNIVPKLLEQGGMSFVDPETHQKTFEASYAVIFVLDDNQLIGCGRALSDGLRQSAIYDVVVDPRYQGQGIGKEIVSRLMSATPDCNFILYASPGKEGFYQSLGFKKMKTGMIFFVSQERMDDENFVEL